MSNTIEEVVQSRHYIADDRFFVEDGD